MCLHSFSFASIFVGTISTRWWFCWRTACVTVGGVGQNEDNSLCKFPVFPSVDFSPTLCKFQKAALCFISSLVSLLMLTTKPCLVKPWTDAMSCRSNLCNSLQKFWGFKIQHTFAQTTMKYMSFKFGENQLLDDLHSSFLTFHWHFSLTLQSRALWPLSVTGKTNHQHLHFWTKSFRKYMLLQFSTDSCWIQNRANTY